ncbi:MAG: FAD-dependent oxidoreductase, partial [Caulobacterales bacterium]|nr:FAD-dependent oxidoreductase [Caulobacterales bacterium]
MQNIIIIGAGQAATQAANSLRQNGFVGNIKIFGNENQAPYQRPPLSKAYLMGEMPIERLEFKALSQWENDNIELRINEPIISINTKANIATSDKGDYNYDKLIFATGSSVRKLEIANNELKNIHYLKSIQDSNLLAKDFETAKNLVVIGGGYIGLEVAAVARKKGLKVTIIEIAPRVLARVACPQISQFYHDIHSQAGVEIITNTGIKELIGTNKVEKIILSNGREIIADVILIGIGIIPNDELAKAAGIICNNGIDVDENSKTSNDDIYACGDCANRVIELYGKRMRLESVHNALEQAKIAAADIMNKPKPK